MNQELDPRDAVVMVCVNCRRPFEGFAGSVSIAADALWVQGEEWMFGRRLVPDVDHSFHWCTVDCFGSTLLIVGEQLEWPQGLLELVAMQPRA